MKIIIFDTETTGLTLPTISSLNIQPYIIELGVIIIKDTQIITHHQWLIKPPIKIDAKITKITGITDDLLKNKPDFKNLLPSIEEVFAHTDIAIAHNAPFDIKMLEFELQRCARVGFPWPKNTLCTMQEFKYAFGKVMKLTSLYEWAMHKQLKQSHRALDDCIALHEILEATNFITDLEI